LTLLKEAYKKYHLWILKISTIIKLCMDYCTMWKLYHSAAIIYK